MDIESVKMEAKLKAVNIYQESLDSINSFLDKKGYLDHPHLSVEVLDCITDDMAQAYTALCNSNSHTLVSTLKELLSIVELHTAAFTIIRQYTE